LLPKKWLPTQPAYQYLLSAAILELGKDVPKTEDTISIYDAPSSYDLTTVYDAPSSYDLTTVPTEMTAQIAGFIDTPNDNKLFLTHS
jgi:hypothetical protein